MPLRGLSPGAPEWREGDVIHLRRPRVGVIMGCYLTITQPCDVGGTGTLAPTTLAAADLAGVHYDATFEEGVLVGHIEADVLPRVHRDPGSFYEHRWGSSAQLDQADRLGRRP